MGDGEADNLVIQFKECFENGGWIVEPIKTMYMGGDPIGMGFTVNDLQSLPDGALGVVNIFGSLGMKLQCIEKPRTGKDANANILTLLIGRKP